MPYLTKEKLEELKERINQLKNEKRQEIAHRINEAKDYGDISENAEFSTAKEERAQNEKEILELEDLIRNAVIIEKSETEKKGKKVVQVGSVATIKIGRDMHTYKIVGSEETDIFKNQISNESPIGQAILGQSKGNLVEVSLPSGKVKVEILDIS